MTNWNARDDASLQDTVSCSSDSDWNDAQAVAQQLALTNKIQRLSFEREYWNHVWEPFVSRLSQVTTATATNISSNDDCTANTFVAGSFNNAVVMGNPDIDCNKYVKFGALKEWCVRQYGQDGYRLATGHYARLYRPADSPSSEVAKTLEENPWLLDSDDETLLLAALDSSKDQSYFLAGCSAASLANVAFPLGDLHKNHGPNSVRALAEAYQLPTATKRDSVGICFVGTRHGGFRQFVRDYLPTVASEPVEFVNIETNQVVGTTSEPDFAGLWAIGQGAKIGGSAQRYFVAGHETPLDRHNRVLVCPGTNHPALFSDTMSITELHWVAQQMPAPLRQQKTMRVKCRIRHLQPFIDATLICHSESARETDHTVTVVFDEPVRGVARGQFAAFYLGAVCLGGGPIDQVGRTLFEQEREQTGEQRHYATSN
jgi:tRNA-5-taurinomethyluridine 2-sulfurtransferase